MEITPFLFFSIVALAVLELLVLVVFQFMNMHERHELTKQLMAKNLTEYQQEGIAKQVLKVEKKKKDDPLVIPPPTHLSLNEVEQDEEAMKKLHAYFNNQ